MVSYIFGGNTGETPQSIARKRAIAEAMVAGRSRAPQNVGEGLNAVGNALAYRMLSGKADKAEAAGMDSASGAFGEIASALGGKGVGSTPYAGEGGSYADAIASLESGGRYDAMGPETGGDRAYGKYQVMGTNIGPWSREALGQEMDPQAFLANPEAQDKVFQHRFGSYVDEYGDPVKAAQAWFGGPGSVGKTSREDVLGTSVGEYGERFAAALGGNGQQPAQGAQGPSTEQLINVLSHPFSTEGQRSVAAAMLEQQMQRQDPMNQIQLDQARLDLEQDREPGAPELETLYDETTGLEYKASYNPATGQYERVGGSKAPSGTSLSVDPETGAVSFTQGNVKPLTEGQSKDVGFVTRMSGSIDTIDSYGAALTNLPQAVAGRAPVVGNYAKSPEYQMAEQAGTEFILALLRKDSGAAVPDNERAEYGRVYLPQPGDSPQVLAQKQVSRRRALIGLQNGLSPTAILALEKGNVDLVDPLTTAPDATVPPAGPADDVDALIRKYAP